MKKDLKISISVDKKTGAIKVVDGEFRELSNSVSKTDKKVDSFNKSLTNIAQAAGGIYVIKQAFDLAKGSLTSLINTASIFETQKSILKTLEGDAIKAEKSFEWIEHFTSNTPYELEKVGESFLKAKAYGIDPTNGSLKTLGDTAAGMGKDLIQAVEAMADAMTGENERLKEFGVKAKVLGDKVAYNWTTSSGKAKHIVVENNSEIIQSTLQALFNSKYEGAMKDQMNTWKGITSNMSDSYTNFLNDIANESGVFDGLKLTLKDLSKEFKGITDNKDNMQALATVTRNSMIMAAKGFEGISNVVIGGIWVFETLDTVIDTTISGAKLNFYYLKEAWLDFMVSAQEYGNKLPDSIKEKLGISQKSLDTVKALRNEARQGIYDSKQEIKNRSDEWQETTNGLALIQGTIHKTVENLENYTLAIDKNTKAKKKNNKTDFGEDGSYSGDKPEDTSDAKAITTSIGNWQNYYETIGDYETAWLIKQGQLGQEYSDLNNEQYQVMYAAAKTEYFDKMDQEKIDLSMTGFDDTHNSMQSILDMQIQLAESGMDWTNSLTGQAGAIADIGKAFTKLRVGELKATKSQATLDKKFTKDWIKLYKSKEDTTTSRADLENKHIKETSTLQDETLRNQIGAYGALAGAASAMYEEGSAGALAMQQVQMALGIVEGGLAVVHQMTSGDVYSAIPRALAVAGMVSQFIGGSGGGSGTTNLTTSDTSEQASFAATELSNDSVTSRLDQQISLLESIDRNGSSSALRVELDKADYISNKDKFVRDVLADSRLGWVPTLGGGASFEQEVIDSLNAWEKNLGVDVYDISDDGTEIRIKQESFVDNADDLIKVFQDFLTNDTYTGPFGQAASSDLGFGESAQQAFANSIEASFVELQGYANDWAIATIESVAELTEASDTLRDSFDSITDSSFYSDQRLTQAFIDLDELSGDGGYGEYLTEQIDNIAKAEAYLDDEKLALLLSKNVEDFAEQTKTIAEFSAFTGETFSDGAKGVLNYIESIELVAEAMATSSANIKSWTDSFKTDTQLAQDLANKISVAPTLATDIEELASLFNQLSTDTEGLTDAESEFLEANKNLLNFFTTNSANEAIKNIQNASASYLPQEDTTFRDINSLINDVNSDNYDDIISSINSAYEYEKDLLTEKFNLEKEILNKQLTAVDNLQKFSSTIRYDNETSIYKIQNSGKLLDSALLKFNDSLISGADTTEALDDIKKYSAGYVDYLKGTSTSSAEYSYGLAALENKLSSTNISEMTTEQLSASITDELLNLEATFDNANDYLGIIATDKLQMLSDTISNQAQSNNDLFAIQTDLSDSTIASVDDLNFNILSQTDTLTELMGADSFIVNSVNDLNTELSKKISEAITPQVEVTTPQVEDSTALDLSSILSSFSALKLDTETILNGINIPSLVVDVINPDYTTFFTDINKAITNIPDDTATFNTVVSEFETLQFDVETIIETISRNIKDGRTLKDLNKTMSDFKIANNTDFTDLKDGKTLKDINETIKTMGDSFLVLYEKDGKTYNTAELLLEISKHTYDSTVYQESMRSMMQAQNGAWGMQSVSDFSLPSFSVGTSNVPRDMIAQIHKKEIIVPSNFSQGLRSGDLTMGNNNEIVQELKKSREINQKMEQRISKMQQDMLLMRKIIERDEYTQNEILEKIGA